MLDEVLTSVLSDKLWIADRSFCKIDIMAGISAPGGWTIETKFHELTETLTCEINTLGDPKAALFGFCLALLAGHAVSLIKTSLRAVHGRETGERKISAHYLSLEIFQTYDGMMIAIPDYHWKALRSLTPRELAQMLKQLAANIKLFRYQKHPRGPKNLPLKTSKYKNDGHVSTAKLIVIRN